jgi:hypothetical protein
MCRYRRMGRNQPVSFHIMYERPARHSLRWIRMSSGAGSWPGLQRLCTGRVAHGGLCQGRVLQLVMHHQADFSRASNSNSYRHTRCR